MEILETELCLGQRKPLALEHALMELRQLVHLSAFVRGYGCHETPLPQYGRMAAGEAFKNATALRTLG